MGSLSPPAPSSSSSSPSSIWGVAHLPAAGMPGGPGEGTRHCCLGLPVGRARAWQSRLWGLTGHLSKLALRWGESWSTSCAEGTHLQLWVRVGGVSICVSQGHRLG